MNQPPLLVSGSAQNLNNGSRTYASMASAMLSLVGSGTTAAAATTLAPVTADQVARVCAFGNSVTYTAARLSDASGNTADPAYVAALAAETAAVNAISQSEWSIILCRLAATGN